MSAHRPKNLLLFLYYHILKDIIKKRARNVARRAGNNGLVMEINRRKRIQLDKPAALRMPRDGDVRRYEVNPESRQAREDGDALKQLAIIGMRVIGNIRYRRAVRKVYLPCQ